MKSCSLLYLFILINQLFLMYSPKRRCLIEKQLKAHWQVNKSEKVKVSVMVMIVTCN